MKRSLTPWVLANAIGFGLAFVAIMQLVNLVELGQWSWSEEEIGSGFRAYFARLVSLFGAGAILGIAQCRLLAIELASAGSWILYSAVGYSAASLIIWPLMYFDSWGGTPAPIEPIANLVGGGSLAGVAQYLYLRRLNVEAGKWLGLWVLGLILSIIPVGLTFTLLYGPLGVSLSWPVEVTINGFITGAVAALVSGGAFFKALSAFGD